MANNMSRKHRREDIAMHGAIRLDSPQFGVMDPLSEETHPQAYYDAIKQRFAEERDLAHQPSGRRAASSTTPSCRVNSANTTRLSTRSCCAPRAADRIPLECLFIGGGFSALLTSARLREIGVTASALWERGADVGGTRHWNRYPGIACDVPSYDYLPLLDEMNYVPMTPLCGEATRFFNTAARSRKIRSRDSSPFLQTTVIETADKAELLWQIRTDRGDHMKARSCDLRQRHSVQAQAHQDPGHGNLSRAARFANSALIKPYTGDDLSGLKDKRVGIIGTGATAAGGAGSGRVAKETDKTSTPSSIDIRDDWETDLRVGESRQPAGRCSAAT
ncbi:MAG: NAD(P)-binding protein [Gammaproteobacteria bacterium]|nr:NAD(P)-binding protein [Gammaproteobacteria bacterium]